MREKDLIGFGAINIDFICLIRKLASLGEEVPVKKFFMYPGGSVPNTIVTLSLLGKKVALSGAVGTDNLGRYLLEFYKKNNINIEEISIKNGITGRAFIFLPELKRKRVIYPYIGVNKDIKDEDMNYKKFEDFKIVHMEYLDIPEQFEIQKHLTRLDIDVSLSIGMIYAKNGLKKIKKLLPNCKFIFLNEREIKVLTGLSVVDGALLLNKLGIKIVIVTLGRKGCIVSSDKMIKQVPTERIKVIDDTGAGDVFTGGFLYGIMEGLSLEDCAKMGNKMASYSLRDFGATSGLFKQKDKGFFR